MGGRWTGLNNIPSVMDSEAQRKYTAQGSKQEDKTLQSNRTL
jgi:hypothetical protein